MIKQIIKSWLFSDNRVMTASERPDHTPLLHQNPTLNFSVYHANGGKVVEFRTYDQKNDRPVFSAYVITDDLDIGEKLSKIITLELLKY